jgi:hypothetical protein
MCQYLAKLAEIDRSRFIMCCEHGSMHLQWDKVRFTFSYREFVHLLIVLEAEQYNVPPHINGVEEWDRWLENQRFRINIDTVTLTLDTLSLAMLVKGMYAALARLGEASNPAEYARRAYRRRMTIPPCTPRRLFSEN